MQYGRLVLPSATETDIGALWRNGNGINYNDSTGTTRLLLTNLGNLSGLSDKAASRANLELGSIALQNASSVAITGGSIAGVSIKGHRPLIPVSASRNFAASDADAYLHCTNTNAITLTIPAGLYTYNSDNDAVEIDIARNGTGAVTIAVATTVTLNGATATKSISLQYQAATLKLVATNTWILHGAYS